MPNLVRVVVLVSGWIGRAHDRWRARVARRFSLRAEMDVLHETLRKAPTEVRLLRARFERLDSHRRPMYLPHERLEILAPGERYGLSVEAIRRAFLVSDQTILNWRAELGLDKPRVVQSDPLINRLPDLVRHIVAGLKREWPAWGTRRIAGILARLGLKASRSSVQRILKRPPKRRPPRSGRALCGTLVAKRPGQIASPI